MHLADVPDVEISFLHTAGIRTLEIDSIPNPNCKANKGGSRPCARGRDNYSKLALFHLTQFRCAPPAPPPALSSLHRARPDSGESPSSRLRVDEAALHR